MVELLVLLGIVFFLLLYYNSKFKTGLRMVATFCPFNFARRFLLKLGGTKIGRGVIIERGVFIGKNISIADGCKIEKFSVIGNGTILSENVKIEQNVSIRMSMIGKSTKIFRGSIIWGEKNTILKIGENCSIGYYAVLDGSGGLQIGDYVHIASPSVGIWTHSSVKNALNGIDFSDISYSQNLDYETVKIGNNIWIGGKVTIYPGVNISDFSVVLPNSVVSKDIPKNSMFGGIPAKYVKSTKDS